MSKQNINYFSRLKALACIAVVLLHTFYAAAAFAKNKDQQCAMLIVRDLMSWAVPCFVMVTGALLPDKQRELGYKKLFGKLMLRMVIALAVFSLLFSCFDTLFISKDFSLSSIKDGLYNVLFGGGWKHMWYLYLMIALYLMMPAYRLVTKGAQNKDIIYLVSVYAAFLCILPTVDILTEKKTAFYICVYSVYPLYLFLGYAMHNGIIMINALAGLLLTLAGAGCIIGLNLYVSGRQTKLSSLLGTYSFIAVAAMSAGIFALMQSCKDKKSGVLDTIAKAIEKCSFGIYLLHMAALKAIFVIFRFDPFKNGGFITVLGISAAVFIVTFIAVRLLRFIKGVNKII